jgi:hypothetical protein
MSSSLQNLTLFDTNDCIKGLTEYSIPVHSFAWKVAYDLLSRIIGDAENGNGRLALARIESKESERCVMGDDCAQIALHAFVCFNSLSRAEVMSC